jgi:hypothetical protein
MTSYQEVRNSTESLKKPISMFEADVITLGLAISMYHKAELALTTIFI